MRTRSFPRATGARLAVAFVALTVLACGGGDAASDTTGAADTARSAGVTPAVDTAPVTPVAASVGASAAVPSAGTPPAPDPDAAAGDTAAPFRGGTAPVRVRGGEPTGPFLLRAVRTARHAGYDRIVFEFSGSVLPHHEVEYVRAPAQCGSGDPVRVAGGVALVARFHGADAHAMRGDRMEPTIADRDRRPALGAVRQLRQICDFEATIEWVMGLDGRRPFRVSSLRDPARVIVDVEAGGAR